MDRREFINTAVAGAGLSLLPGAVLPGDSAQAGDKLHVALIGHGRQGSVLFDAMRNIPGLHFQAVCDIFELPGDLNKPPHTPHLENFFAAIRGEATLNCDARRAFASEAPMHWINPSARSRQAITFTGEHLAV